MEATAEAAKKATKVTVRVNNKKVKIKGPKAIGLQIKQAAIDQGVDIELDFQLAKIKANGQHKIIGDNDETRVTDESKFVATASDDNS